MIFIWGLVIAIGTYVYLRANKLNKDALNQMIRYVGRNDADGQERFWHYKILSDQYERQIYVGIAIILIAIIGAIATV